MAIAIKDVTRYNYYEVGLLTTNTDGMPTFDEAFLCANMVSLAESKYYPLLQPKAIYNDAVLIGFIMYGPYAYDNGNFWIQRYMIDYKFQGKGYGKKGFAAALEEIRTTCSTSEIFIGLAPENEKAIALYSSFGFVYTGEVKDEEMVYRLELTHK